MPTGRRGLMGLARGFRLRVFDGVGQLVHDRRIAEGPTLDDLKCNVPEGGKAFLEQAAFMQNRRIIWSSIAWFHHIADDLVRDHLTRLRAPIDKVTQPGIATPTGLDDWIEKAGADLAKAARNYDQAGLAAVKRTIEERAALLNPKDLPRFNALLGTSYAGATKGIWDAPGIKVTLGKDGAAVVRQSSQQYLGRFHPNVSFKASTLDAAQVDFMSESKGFFIKDEYGRRPQWLADKTKSIMAPMFKEGLGTEEMAKTLTAKMGKALPGKTHNYWQTVADNHVTRARSWGISGGMEQAGITTFYYQSVIDEATTDICRWANGKEVSVADARALMLQGDTNPAKMDRVNPFIKQTRKGDIISLKIPEAYKGGQVSKWKTLAATTKQMSGAGTFGTGKWAVDFFKDAPPGALPAEGIGLPPLHHR